jgi:hypothetical protein
MLTYKNHLTLQKLVELATQDSESAPIPIGKSIICKLVTSKEIPENELYLVSGDSVVKVVL